jgi:hypothetical protein
VHAHTTHPRPWLTAWFGNILRPATDEMLMIVPDRRAHMPLTMACEP